MNIYSAQTYYNNTSPAEVKKAIQMELDFVHRLLLGIQNDNLWAIEARRIQNLQKSIESMGNWQNKAHQTEIIDEKTEQLNKTNKNNHGQRRAKRHLANCKICGRQSQYSFYGVRSCEGCKQFFRRVVAKQTLFTCPRRNGIGSMVKCRGCRLDKCLVAGMDPTMINVPQSDKFKQFLDNLEKRKRSAMLMQECCK
ncbi:hypothetical protein niasHS_000246 [Heterodera schachtii]|uniref:Nuclear receptor domain-containing protein n=1 Tax=Heterodera schachtii TaxID=97005 RepID=A0ABD2KHP0_HETSC